MTRPLYRATLPFQRMLLRRRVRKLVLEEVDGVLLVVLPDVFNGVVFRTGALLARSIAKLAPAASDNAAALDMGTGTGIGALFAARAGYRVTAVDVNPEAVRCARINALLNRFEEKVDVREGDLFEAVGGARFDLVLFNPPFFEGEPRDLEDAAWRGEAVFSRFLAGLPSAMKPGGVALLVLSSHGDPAAALVASGRPFRVESTHDFGNEILSIYSLRYPS
jgi:HemK-related putative methylase